MVKCQRYSGTPSFLSDYQKIECRSFQHTNHTLSIKVDTETTRDDGNGKVILSKSSTLYYQHLIQCSSRSATTWSLDTNLQGRHRRCRSLLRAHLLLESEPLHGRAGFAKSWVVYHEHTTNKWNRRMEEYIKIHRTTFALLSL